MPAFDAACLNFPHEQLAAVTELLRLENERCQRDAAHTTRERKTSRGGIRR
jgi:hypothetical protein